MANACDHCGESVKDMNDHIVCMGFCDQVTHIKCAKLNEPIIKNIQERTNLFWMCRQCAHLMNLARFKQVMASIGSAVSCITDNHSEQITDLKHAISNNGKQMELLSKKVTASTPLSSRSNRNSDSQPRTKRPREENPGDSNPLLGGTKTLATNSTVLTVSPPKRLFWLYLSRIHPSVKSEAVLSLAKESLQCDEPIKVIMLVKKHADLTSMRFISFKIGIDEKYRDIALDRATWPQGIVFREFEDDSLKNLWVPTENRAPNKSPRIELTPALSTNQSTNFLSPNPDSEADATPMDSK